MGRPQYAIHSAASTTVRVSKGCRVASTPTSVGVVKATGTSSVFKHREREVGASECGVTQSADPRDWHSRSGFRMDLSSMTGWFDSMLDWLRSLFFKQEMELSLIGLQNAGKSSFVNVLIMGAHTDDMIPTVGFNMRKVRAQPCWHPTLHVPGYWSSLGADDWGLCLGLCAP